MRLQFIEAHDAGERSREHYCEVNGKHTVVVKRASKTSLRTGLTVVREC